MEKVAKRMLKSGLAIFNIDISQKLNKEGSWKKELKLPNGWSNFTKEKTVIDEKKNGLVMITGKVNNIIVIDIDNIEHWKLFLKTQKQEEPETLRVITGSGGKHLYFKYNDELDDVKSKTKIFGKEYDIDIRTNGGCIICPPSRYYNNNLDMEVEYKWEYKNKIDIDNLSESIKEMPEWLKDVLKSKNVSEKIVTKINEKIEEMKNKNEKKPKVEVDENKEWDVVENNEIDFTEEELEVLLTLLSESRCDNYDEWLKVGMILYNMDKNYRHIWKSWSKQSEKYESGCCEEKWKSFKKSNLCIGTLLMWCKEDNKEKYDEFIKKRKLRTLVSQKYPNDKIILGDTIMVNDKCNYTTLKNEKCLIKGEKHKDMENSMYLDLTDRCMSIKCKHAECFGKIHPCQHILLNKNEMNIAFNGDIHINMGKDEDELVEFQKIDLYEDEKLNELVYNSLNGESYPMAKIVYHYFPLKFNYGEDDYWYMFDNTKWINIGKKNLTLRDYGQDKLKEIYNELINYYKENDGDKNKIKELKKIKKSIDNTNMKNNIMNELVEVYSLNNNLKRNFVKNLDMNNNLIGFNNGVYDLDKFEFRDGNPNDNITMSVGYDYKNQHTDKYNDLLKFLEDIQPNKEERDYMLTYLSIALVGNLLELFTIMTGCGRNGKSKLIELLGKTFGEYFGSVQSQMFTRQRPDANSPDPGLLSLSKKRLVIASEPEKNSKLNSGFIKFITGRDTTTLRNCHSNDMIEFNAKFITLLICNDIPDTDDIDIAFSKRLRCIHFPTEFVDDPKKENQKKIDTNINLKFNDWKLDFMLLLLEYYKKYNETKILKATKDISKWTDQYKENTDIYLQFLNENTEESDTHIHCSTLYETFKIWFKNNNPYTKIPSNKEFVNNLRKHKDIKKVVINEKVLLGIKNLNLIDNNE
jgi:P4 family phage/plasmid primase-like protien